MKYVPAQIEALDKAGEFICGTKFLFEALDSITLEVALLFTALDAINE